MVLLRWMVMGMVLLEGLLSMAAAQSVVPARVGVATQTPDLVLHEGAEIPLWPDGPNGVNGAPGGVGNAADDRPTLRVYLPKGSNPTKTGVIIAPGGGYAHLSMQKEGESVALWLNSHGVAAFVLKYRLGPKYHHPVEIGDAQRAIRTVRARAAEYGVAVDHVGIWGFSAGGHLAATAGTRYDAGMADAKDEINRQGCRPDFLVLAYPVITFGEKAHAGSRKYLLGDDPDPALVKELSAETRVTKDTPPTFLFSTTDDKTVPVANSVMFYSALVDAGVPAELHIFQHGPHGVGLAPNFPDLKGWPDLLATWMQARGFMAAGS